MSMLNNIILFLILLCNLSFPQIPDAIGRNGAVTSSNAYATKVGIDILKAGGNAIDAAVAVGFALAVTHPGAGNIGGGGFMVLHLSRGDVITLDFRETAPAKASRDMFLDEKGDVIPGKSWNTALAAGVPGSVDGFDKIHKLHGILPWEMVVSPAQKLAEDGFILDRTLAKSLGIYKNFLSRDSVSKKVFVKDKDYFQVGEIFKQPDLAKTLKRIQVNGAREFYEGETAQNIIQCMNRTGGIISLKDLKDYQSIIREPIKFEYRGYTIYSMPPPSSGGIALAGILNQLENVDLSKIEYHSKDHVQYLTEAERNVYSDRAFYLGDMDFIDVPIDELVDQDYSNKRWNEIDFNQSRESKDIIHGIFNNHKESEETTHYSVTDRWGNAVSVTTTVNGWFGNGITVDNAGFLLNNEMDDFSSKPGVPNKYGLVGAEANAIYPGKRMLSSMTPTIILDKDKKLFLVLGSPGGSTIITTVAQVAMNVIDFGMTIEEAVESKRIHHQWLPDIIYAEPNSILDKQRINLTEIGYTIKKRQSIGEANCILFDNKNGIFYSSGDSRRRANAKAY